MAPRNTITEAARSLDVYGAVDLVGHMLAKPRFGGHHMGGEAAVSTSAAAVSPGGCAGSYFHHHRECDIFLVASGKGHIIIISFGTTDLCVAVLVR